jgi:imidazole glycerol-phosphate synthase subunit HisH
MLVALPNLRTGNFASVIRMVQKVGGSARLVDSPADLRGADKIILAGVGAFDNGMASLREGRWIDPLNEAIVERKVPVLGICLGMQLMFQRSEEGILPGLGWVDGEVRHFNLPSESGLKVPHMGWNTVTITKLNPLFPVDGNEQRFYFVHSYHAHCAHPDDVVATATHGYPFTAALSRDNLYGVQFHPEKSHRFGMAIIKNFLAL